MRGELEGRFLEVDAVIISAAPFVAVVDRHEMRNRLANGLLRDSPKLYVTVYSAEHHSTTLFPLDWAVAEALAPALMRRLVDRLDAERASMIREQLPTAQG
jgi:hypothetical protein